MGYHRAGFEVVGVDNWSQPNYPFKMRRIDALKVLQPDLKSAWNDWHTFDAIHASPPCQAHSVISPYGARHTTYIPELRELLIATGKPYIIENVENAAWYMRKPVKICGSMFDPLLGVKRHRLFETNWPLAAPNECRHDMAEPRYDVYDHGKWSKIRFCPVYGDGGGKCKDQWPEAMGIDWMTARELTQAIPPVYTEYIGNQLLNWLAVQPDRCYIDIPA